MDIILEAQDIARTYTVGKTSLNVLTGVSLQIQTGDSLSITGESGSGKSTLMHVLGGLDRPKSGRVLFQGQDVYTLPASRRARFRAENIGFVFQSFHLLPELDILENVALPAMAVQTSTDARTRAAKLLDAVGLNDRMKHRPRELSGGEQQRVAIARALMNEPDIIFADEPTGNLDSATGEKVLNYLFQLTEDRRHSLVLVTHNGAVAARCAHQQTLRDGVLI